MAYFFCFTQSETYLFLLRYSDQLQTFLQYALLQTSVMQLSGSFRCGWLVVNIPFHRLVNTHVSQLQWHTQFSYPGIYSYVYDIFTCWWQDIFTHLCATPVCAAAALGFGIFHFIWPTAVEMLQLSLGPFRMDQLSVNLHTALTWAHTHSLILEQSLFDLHNHIWGRHSERSLSQFTVYWMVWIRMW